MIANGLINTDYDKPVRVANVFPNPMHIKKGKVLALCEPVTKIFYHDEDLSNNNDEEIKSSLEISALELGHLTDHQRKVAREFLQ